MTMVDTCAQSTFFSASRLARHAWIFGAVMREMPYIALCMSISWGSRYSRQTQSRLFPPVVAKRPLWPFSAGAVAINPRQSCTSYGRIEKIHGLVNARLKTVRWIALFDSCPLGGPGNQSARSYDRRPTPCGLGAIWQYRQPRPIRPLRRCDAMRCDATCCRDRPEARQISFLLMN